MCASTFHETQLGIEYSERVYDYTNDKIYPALYYTYAFIYNSFILSIKVGNTSPFGLPFDTTALEHAIWTTALSSSYNHSRLKTLIINDVYVQLVVFLSVFSFRRL
jgi:hypothetical protein